MKHIFLLVTYFIASYSYAQYKEFNVVNVSLPAELSFYDNQFSGMYVQKENLYLMSESRLQDNAEAKLYSLKLIDIEKKKTDTDFVLPFKKIAIKNLDKLRNRMFELGDDYEGLEAMTIDGNDIYFTVETATPSNNCYMLKGLLQDTIVELDLKVLIPLPKPITKDKKHIYNAGYEAMAKVDNTIYNFFEYNSFEEKNLVVGVMPLTYRDVMIQLPTIQNVPFRITDITQTGKNTFTAINYFYKGEGEDEVYRVPKTDKVNDKLIKDGFGYKSYCRLISLKYKKNKFTWEPLWQFPASYMSYNWECIAAYNDGYFILNDKYTPARPYKSTLLYLEKVK
jgi:hypothetical protein